MTVAMTDDTDTQLKSTLAKLDVPPDFAEYERTTEADVVVRLEEWRRAAYAVLCDLRTRLAAIARQEQQPELPLETRARVVYIAAQFDGDGAWVLDTTKDVAREILAPYDTPSSEPDLALLTHLLTHHIKPVFHSNPHPAVHLSTGRRLARPAGGRAGVLDYYEAQAWKRRPGAPNVLAWCVRHIEGTMYERVWHLVIPPMMTLLDDYEVPYKTLGVRIVSEMLDRVPPELLRRTGMDGLILASLHKCFPNLRDPGTPALLRLAVPTCVQFIEATTPPGSKQRFDQLCAVFGDGVIGAVWFYSGSERAALEASLDTLPVIVDALGVGVARYLKAIIPQLTYPLLTAPAHTTPLSTQLASARALRAVLAACAPRAHRWRGDVLDAVCRCWVALGAPGAEDKKGGGGRCEEGDEGEHREGGEDCGTRSPMSRAVETDGPLTRGFGVGSDAAAENEEEKERRELREALQDVCADLARMCPSVVQNEYARLQRASPHPFSALVAPRGNEGADR
ncbi:hypothetical protein EIP86_010315 [Pleurotus ostreatoroseus]|nr:hypothetical protein EIP86_010315 [Pleurotus ostreatoroseus]